jgi:hypothetical protein
MLQLRAGQHGVGNIRYARTALRWLEDHESSLTSRVRTDRRAGREVIRMHSSRRQIRRAQHFPCLGWTLQRYVLAVGGV